MDKNQEKNSNQYLSYLGLGFQFIAGVGGGIWLGWWIDKKLVLSIPIFIWLLPLLIVVGMLYSLIKQFNNKTKNDE